MMKSLEQIARMQAYNPPLEQRMRFSGLRLDFNERLKPLSENVVNAIKNFDPSRISLYPSYDTFGKKVANYAGVKISDVMITNGSDQGIELIFKTFVGLGDLVVIPSPSFAMFYQVAQYSGAEILRPCYGCDGVFPLEEVRRLFERNPKLLIICNPNNPTGTLLNRNEIEEILKRFSNTIVYVDEAYFEFSYVTVADLVEKYSNLVVTRTFSKAFGLASLRLGYLVSCEQNIREMLKVRGPYDVNQIAKMAGAASLEDLSDVKNYCDEVMNKAKPMLENFLRSQGVCFLNSAANFVYFKEPWENFSKELEGKGILVRPRENGFARVTIGTVEQMKRFIKIFKQLTKQND